MRWRQTLEKVRTSPSASLTQNTGRSAIDQVRWSPTSGISAASPGDTQSRAKTRSRSMSRTSSLWYMAAGMFVAAGRGPSATARRRARTSRIWTPGVGPAAGNVGSAVMVERVVSRG